MQERSENQGLFHRCLIYCFDRHPWKHFQRLLRVNKRRRWLESDGLFQGGVCITRWERVGKDLVQYLREEGFPGGTCGKEPACQCKRHRKTRARSLDQKQSLEKGMATHSRILAWRIPWTEEPGGLQSLGLQRVRYDSYTYA